MALQLSGPIDQQNRSIVFVHGPRGHLENTWKAECTLYPWPQTLLPGKIPNARILTFGYDATVTDIGSMLSIKTLVTHSRDFLSAIATHRRKDAVRRKSHGIYGYKLTNTD